MALTSIDFLSPKITLYHKGRNSHVSQIGGLLSLCLLILIFIIIFYIIWDIINPKLFSLFIYEKYNINNKVSQNISYSGINHFIQIYSNKGNGKFGDYENKNLIIYSIRENKTTFYDNININLSDSEHWLYDKCENVIDIHKNLFSEISKNIPNYSKSICLKYYSNPYERKYYEIGFDGYISPYLESNDISEKKYGYRIIIEKCVNNSLFKSIGYYCNPENEINKYLEIYTEIFTYFSNNQIIPMNYKNPFEKYYYSVSSKIHGMAFFENNIVFSNIKLLTDKHIFREKKENLSYILSNNYQNKNILFEKSKLIGIFSFYLNNKIIIYNRKYFNILDKISHLGGLFEILFFIFQLLNYINYRYTILEDTRTLFQIGTGIETINLEEKENSPDKNHISNFNYKIKVFNNNNNIINGEEINHRLAKNYFERENKKKNKIQDQGKNSNRNNIIFVPSNNNKINKNVFLNQRSRTKYLYNENQNKMGKQLTIKNKNKRKSYMSQGYHTNITKYENSLFSKNPSDLSNELISNNDKSIINNSNALYQKEGTLKFETGFRTPNDLNININKIKKNKKSNVNKHNQNKPSIERGETTAHLIMSNMDNAKSRHQSVNFTNQKKIFENNNNTINANNKLSFFGKNSSGLFNDSSKQILVSNKPSFLIHNNKGQYEKRYDEYSRLPTILYNDAFTNNITNALNNNSIDPSIFLKTIIQNKLKFHMHEAKKNFTFGGVLEKEINYFDFFKSLFIVCRKNENDNKLHLINNFRKKLLSEEHLYREFINLYLIEKIFQIEETQKFDIYELYNNL